MPLVGPGPVVLHEEDAEKGQQLHLTGVFQSTEIANSSTPSLEKLPADPRSADRGRIAGEAPAPLSGPVRDRLLIPVRTHRAGGLADRLRLKMQEKSTLPTKPPVGRVFSPSESLTGVGYRIALGTVAVELSAKMRYGSGLRRDRAQTD